MSSVAGGKNVVYNKVITDVANIYDNTTGIVTIKSPGIYIIQFYSVSQQDEEIYQELYHNSDFVCGLYDYANNEWSNAGNTAILHLKAGDTLSVRAAAQYTNNIYGGTDEVYTTFNGVMIASEGDLNNKGKWLFRKATQLFSVSFPNIAVSATFWYNSSHYA